MGDQIVEIDPENNDDECKWSTSVLYGDETVEVPKNSIV